MARTIGKTNTNANAKIPRTYQRNTSNGQSEKQSSERTPSGTVHQQQNDSIDHVKSWVLLKELSITSHR